MFSTLHVMHKAFHHAKAFGFDWQNGTNYILNSDVELYGWRQFALFGNMIDFPALVPCRLADALIMIQYSYQTGGHHYNLGISLLILS